MICYLDKTFCASPNCENKCGRQFTKEISDGAKKWMGEDAPIAFSDFCKNYRTTSGEELSNMIKAKLEEFK